MTIIGKQGDICRPKAYVEGPSGKIEISSVSCTYSVGSIPMCRVFVPPEFLGIVPEEGDDQLYTVKVTDGESEAKTLFTGYVAGSNAQISEKRIMAGIDLIHPARDLDEGRISSPSLHPNSVMDYTYFVKGGFKKSSEILEGGVFFTKGGGPVAKQALDGLATCLTQIIGLNPDSASGGPVKIGTLEKTIDLLKKVTVLNGTLKDEVETGLQGTVQDRISLQSYFHSRFLGSFNSARSVWDTLCSTFSEMGLYMICDNEGKVSVSADCSGLIGGDNRLGPDYIVTLDKSSVIKRPIGEVNLIGMAVRKAASAKDPIAQPLSVATYPPDGSGKGATLTLQIPGWLNPVMEVGSEGGCTTACQAYAKAMYYQEKSKFRTMTASGPLAPLAIPGTVAKITPFSAMRPLSGSSIGDFQKTYLGYCYQIIHTVDVQEKTMKSTFCFSNVSPEESDGGIDEHPLFSDVKPFTWK